jgi:pyruvate carboxylase subunit B
LVIWQKNDEDVLTYALFPEVGKQFLEQRSTGNLVPEPLELESRKGDGIKKAPTEFNVALHGESYHVKVTGAGPKKSDVAAFLFHRRRRSRGYCCGNAG